MGRRILPQARSFFFFQVPIALMLFLCCLMFPHAAISEEDPAKERTENIGTGLNGVAGLLSLGEDAALRSWLKNKFPTIKMAAEAAADSFTIAKGVFDPKGRDRAARIEAADSLIQIATRLEENDENKHAGAVSTVTAAGLKWVAKMAEEPDYSKTFTQRQLAVAKEAAKFTALGVAAIEGGPTAVNRVKAGIDSTELLYLMGSKTVEHFNKQPESDVTSPSQPRNGEAPQGDSKGTAPSGPPTSPGGSTPPGTNNQPTASTTRQSSDPSNPSPTTTAAAGSAKTGGTGDPSLTTAPPAGQAVNQQAASSQQTASTYNQQTTTQIPTTGQPGDSGTAPSAPAGNAGAGTTQDAAATTAPSLADQTPEAQELQRQQLNQQYPDDPAFQKAIGSRDDFSPQDIEARQKWHEAQDKALSDYQDKEKLAPMDPNLKDLQPSDDIKNLVDPPVNAADKVQLGDAKNNKGSDNLSDQAFALAKEGQDLADALNSGQTNGIQNRLVDLRARVEGFQARIPPGGAATSTDPNVTALLDAAKGMMALGQAAMRDPGSAKGNLAEANRLLNQARQSAAEINGNQSRSSPSTISGGGQQPEQSSLGTDNVTGGGVGFQIQKSDLKPSAKANSSGASTMRGFVGASSNARPAATGAKPALTLTVTNGSGATGDFKSVWPSSSGGGMNKFTSSSSSSATGSRPEAYKLDSGSIGTASVKQSNLQVSNGTGASIALGASAATTSPRITTTLQPSVNIRAATTAASNAATGAASNAAGKTASTAASTAASGAASSAASKAAAGAASRAASTVASTSASNAASHAASNAAASAAGRAAASAASNAASKAASNAASNAASRAASSAASNAASRAASNAASNAAANAASRIRIPSDIRLKQDIVELATLVNGLRLYRYRYIGDRTFYVGVMAQEVAQIDPAAVGQDANGYLSVDYAKLGIDFLTFEAWAARRAAPVTP